MSRGLTLEQMAFLVGKGVSAEEMLAFAQMGELPSDAAAERSARYRSRMDVAPEEWARLRQVVFARDGHACTYCGSTVGLTCDHVLPLIQGGTSALDNLTTACRVCNSGKSGMLVSEWQSRGA